MTGLYQSYFLQALGWTLIDSVWKFGSLWTAYQLLTGTGKNFSSSKKYFLAVIALGIGVFWTAFGMVNHYRGLADGTPIVNSFWLQFHMYIMNRIDGLFPVLSLVYLATLLVFAGRFFWRNMNLSRDLKEYAPTDNGIYEMAVSLAHAMHIDRKIDIRMSANAVSAMTFGVFKAVIVLPVAAINKLTLEETRSILAHEMIHIRRHDYLVNLLLLFCKACLFYNPFVYFFHSIIEQEREKSCDDIVVSLGINPWNYANALFVLSGHRSVDAAPAMQAAGEKSLLLGRIRRILNCSPQPSSAITFSQAIRSLSIFFLCLFGTIFWQSAEKKPAQAISPDTAVAAARIIEAKEIIAVDSSLFIEERSGTTAVSVTKKSSAQRHLRPIAVPAPPPVPVIATTPPPPRLTMATTLVSQKTMARAFTFMTPENNHTSQILNRLADPVPYVPNATFYYTQVDDSLSASGKTIIHL